MRSLRAAGLVLASALLAASLAQAARYGDYDPRRILLSETTGGKQRGLDVAYLDSILNDLAHHAENYPVQFDSPEDQQRAVRDVRGLSAMLHVLADDPNPNPAVVLRTAFLDSMGHNLDIPGAAEKANAGFLKFLATAPKDRFGNYWFGKFLASASKPAEALPYLERAVSAGEVGAEYTIGLVYLTLGDKTRALEHLEKYKRLEPADKEVDKLIDAVRNGEVEIRKS